MTKPKWLKIDKAVVLQLIIEFRVQFIISVLWVIYSIYTPTGYTNEFIESIKAFIACLFFSSWFASQILRVKKQQKVESEFENVKKDIQIVLMQLKNQADDVVGFATGAGAELDLTPTYSIKLDSLTMVLSNQSKYPAFSIEGHWKMHAEAGKSETDRFNTKDLHPWDHGYISIPCKGKTNIWLDIVVTHRSGVFKYVILCKKIKDKYVFAIRYDNKDDKFKYYITKYFPGYTKGKEEELFSTKAFRSLRDETYDDE